MNPKDIKAKAAELTGKLMHIEVATKALSIDEEKKTATFVMSTESIDRHGDIVDQESMMLEHFLKNPGFFWAHRSNEYPLGKWVKVWKEADPELEGKLMTVGTAEFATELHEDIERAWNHVVRGDLNMVSIGFIPHRVEYDEEADCFRLFECELMECSLVGIGSNRRAQIKADVDVSERLIETKKQAEEAIKENPTDPTVNRYRHGIYLLNKAIRQFQK